ncbi:hypothetical protein EBB07_33940 [Paenibacillaceae bacterium]|nr:hypothetical protein EBB07_33940 [Paenibacillaceae bacterium]
MSIYNDHKDLDREFAKLIGYMSLTNQLNPDGSYGTIPTYSTTWDGMRQVIEAMQRRGYRPRFADQISHWKARFYNESNGQPTSWVCGESAPYAVCLAAIRALQGEAKS